MAQTPKIFVTAGEAKASLPVIQSLGSKGFEIHVGRQTRICAGMLSRFVAKNFTYTAPEERPEDFIEELCAILSKERYDALIPVGDEITALISRNKQRLLEHTGLALADYEVFMKGRDKEKTLKIALANEIPIPRSHFPSDEAIHDIAAKATYPVVIKPAISHGSRGITLVHRKEELKEKLEKVSQSHGRCFVQEYVPHGGTQYKADILMDGKGEVKAGIVYSKLRYYPLNGGSSILNCTVERPDILENAVRLLRAMKWVGFADFDFIEDPRDNQVKLMEINPRLPESFRITLAAGIDFPYMLYRMAVGEEIPSHTGYRVGVYARFLPGDILWFLKSPDRWKAKPGFFKFFGKDVHYYILSARDPGPFIGYMLENFAILFSPAKFRFRFVRTP